MRRAIWLVLASCVEVAPAYQIPITATPTLTELAPFEFTNAVDDIDDGCAPPAMRDVLFEITTPIAQTYVFDTGGATTTDVALSIHDGNCPGAANRLACSSSTTIPSTNPCGNPSYNNLAVTLPGPHTFCLVVSETEPSDEGSVSLRVFAGGVAATVLNGSGLAASADACTGNVGPSLDCVLPAGDRATAAAVVVLCPGQTGLATMVAPDPTLTAAVALHAILPAGPQALCTTGSSPGAPISFAAPDLPSPVPYWFLVQRATTSCGGFRISATAQ